MRPRCACRENPHCCVSFERRQIEKPSDSVYVEQVGLMRSPCETHGDHRRFGEELVALQCFERQGHEHFVLADHEIGLKETRDGECVAKTCCILGLDSETGKESREMVGQIR